MTITVSMPYHAGTAPVVARAVESVLASTGVDLELVVVNDGGDPDEAWAPLVHVDDPRLVRFDLAVNRGRYYADAVTLAACDTEWWAPVDSDDWVEPDRFARMVAAGDGHEVVVGSEVVHGMRRTEVRRPDLVPPGPERMRHLWHSAQLYRPGAVAGLIHPGFRVGWDTLFSNLVALSCDVGVAETEGYHREARAGSLTRSRSTGMGSRVRKDAVRSMTRLYRRAVARPDRCRRIVQRDVEPGLRAAVAADAARLRGPDEVDASDVVVTVLTGCRPDLLERTLVSTREVCPGLLESARVVVLHNGGDEATAGVLAGHRDVIDRLDVTDGLVSIGEAMFELSKAVKVSRRAFWLHLEDDWEASPDPGWLDRARGILVDRPEVGQVRLRSAVEPVLRRHMVTRVPLRWSDRGAGWSWCADAHVTTNPNLTRVAHVRDWWPADGERHAQRRWLEAGHREVAQLVPGVWSHIGGGRSLREETGCAA